MKSINIIDWLYPGASRIDRFIDLSEKYSGRILILSFLISVIALFGTINLFTKVDTGLEALLPEDYISVQTLRKVNRESANLYENLFVQGKSTEEIISYGKELEKNLEKNPNIFEVDIKVEEILPKKYAFLILSQERLTSIRDRVQKKISQTKLKKTGFFISLFDDDEIQEQGPNANDLALSDIKEDIPQLLIKKGTVDEYYLSRDKRVLDVRVKPNKPPTNLDTTQKVYNIINSEIARLQPDYPDVKVSIFGPYRKRLEEYSLIQKDVKIITTFTVIAIILSLILFYRQIGAVFMIGIPLFMGLLWTMGITDITLGHLNTMTAFLAGILFGLGIDFSVHMYSRFLNDRRKGIDRRQALKNMLTFAGRSSFTSALTTAVVFFSLMLADFKGFSEFGYIAGLGVLICFLAISLVLPSLIIWFDNHKLYRVQPIQFHFLKSFTQKIPKIFPENLKRFPYPKPIIAFSLGLMGLFFIIAPYLEFEYDFNNLKSDLIEYKKERKILKKFNYPKSTSAAVVVMNTKEDIPAVRKSMLKIIQKENSPVASFMALDFVWPFPEEQKARMKIINEIKEIMDDDALRLLKGKDRKDADYIKSYLDAEFLPIEDVPLHTIQIFSPREGAVGSYGYATALNNLDLRDGRSAIQFANMVKNIPTERGVFHASSQEVVFADVLGIMLKDSKSAILLSLFLICLLVWLDFGKIRHAFLVLTPLISGTMLMMIFLFSFGQKISFYNVIVIPLIIGLGVDDGIHLYHRYLQEGRGSICKTIQTTGHAVMVTSITTFLGFFGLAFSHHNGLKSIGYLAMAGILGCFLTSVIVLPAVIQFLEDRKQLKVSCNSSDKAIPSES